MGNNWQNRDRKVNNRRTNKSMAKPFKKSYKTISDSKRVKDIEIKKAQKAKYTNLEELED